MDPPYAFLNGPALILYAFTASLYFGLATLAIVAGTNSTPRSGRYPVLAAGMACGLTATWVALVAARGDADPLTDVVWLAQAFAWIEVLIVLDAIYCGQRAASGIWPRRMLLLLGALLALTLSLGWALAPAVAASAATELKMIVSLATLVLVENIMRNGDAQSRWHLGPPAIAIATTAAVTLLLYGDAVLHHRLSATFLEARAALLVLVTPLLWLGAARHRQWRRRIALSHEATFYSAALILGGAFLIAVGVLGMLIDRYGRGWGGVAEVTLFGAALISLGVLFTSGSARSRLWLLVTDHFFAQRYDYRREWQRCLATLAADHAGNLHQRAIKVLADTLDSPAGAIYLRGEGSDSFRFQLADGWNVAQPLPSLPAAAPWLTDAETDGFRRLHGPADGLHVEDGARDAPILAWPERAWLVVPLPDPHGGPTMGAIVLDAPRAAMPLDREGVALIKVVGREIALVLAERRAAEALAESRRFETAAKRFAFVAHDIKNVANQLSLLIDNADHHLDDPAFRDDMMATLREAVGKISTLVRRINAPEPDVDVRCDVSAELDRLREQAPPDWRDRIAINADLASGARTRADPQHRSGILAVIETFAFHRILTQLIDNAIDASPPGAPVSVTLTADASSVTIAVSDVGAGMTADFIGNSLFRPFATTKSGGFGLGAYQARELARMAGGDLFITSTPTVGTTATLRLRRAHRPETAARAIAFAD